jgi:ribosomal protein S18 acetylase RimI-like enzyme
VTVPGYTLRPATWEDAEYVYGLNECTMKEYVEATWGPWSEEFQRKFFREHFRPEENQIVLIGRERIGNVGYLWEDGRWYLSYIRLEPEWQGKGIGAELVRGVMEEAAKRDTPVDLDVLKMNPAKRLYERLGFRVTGETETHFQMRWVPPRGR